MIIMIGQRNFSHVVFDLSAMGLSDAKRQKWVIQRKNVDDHLGDKKYRETDSLQDKVSAVNTDARRVLNKKHLIDQQRYNSLVIG